MRLMWIVFGWLPIVLVAAPVCVAAPGERFEWPLRPRPAVVRAFDKPAQNWLPGHRGVDLSGSTGDPVLAAGDGTVVFAGTVAGKPVVSVDHAGGLRTTYEPVTASVTVGRRVIHGEAIGVLAGGHEGCPVAACLHWGLRRDGDYLDPLGLLRAIPIRLKPLAATGETRLTADCPVETPDAGSGWGHDAGVSGGAVQLSGGRCDGG
nr:M23 family metallopeptidase [Nocardia yamanashiensis]